MVLLIAALQQNLSMDSSPAKASWARCWLGWLPLHYFDNMLPGDLDTTKGFPDINENSPTAGARTSFAL
jgi:hypothetical protein